MEKMDQVQASEAVLIEVMNVLGLYRDHLILVGVWVLELLLPKGDDTKVNAALAGGPVL